MRNVDLVELKARFPEVPGEISQTNIGGRMVFGINGLTVGVDPDASDEGIFSAIQQALAARTEGVTVLTPAVPPAAAAETVPAATPLPPSPVLVEPQAKPMSAPAPARRGSFAAGIKSIMDEAMDGVRQAQADGMRQVQDAARTLNDARDATVHVSGKIADTIRTQASDVMAELGQVSNDFGID